MRKSGIRVVSMLALTLAVVMTPATVFAETYSTDTSDNTYGVVLNDVFTSAGSRETNAITAMRQKALYSWNGPSHSYTYHQKYSNGVPTAATIELISGEYRGIPYQMKAYSASASTHEGTREKWHSSATSVQNAVNEMVQYNQDSVKGTDCSSSVSYAWRQALSATGSTNGVLMLPSSRDSSGKFRSAYTCKRMVQDGNHTSPAADNTYGDYITRVGQYGQVANTIGTDTRYNNTYNTIIDLKSEGNFTGGADIYLRVYSKMEAGDILVSYRDSLTHAQLVEKVVISKTNGVVDPDDSYVLVTEQVSHIMTCNNDAYETPYYTTWRVRFGEGEGGERKYSFRYLASSGGYYLPYRYNGNMATPISGFVTDEVTTTSMNVHWNAIEENCDGYELQYALSPEFAEVETLKLNDRNKTDACLERLVENGTYYVRIRSYRITETGDVEYSGYNCWLEVNLANGKLYRYGAPQLDGSKEAQETYDDYVYRDIGFDFGDDGIED